MRWLLRRHPVRPAEALREAFHEDEEGMVYGALVKGDPRVIESHWRIGRHRRRPRVPVWRDRTDDPEVVIKYPQVAVALEMHGAERTAASDTDSSSVIRES
jgi:hypothetical protein